MGSDISGVIRSLHESAVGRCRDRIEEAACKARGLISRGGGEQEAGQEEKKPQYGVTSMMKRRHGL